MPLNHDLLEKLARRYVWWKAPEDAIARPERIVAQVMNMGDYDDVQSLFRAAGPAYLCEVLTRAEAGQFEARSWAYWHYRLGLSGPGNVPPLPERRLPDVWTLTSSRSASQAQGLLWPDLRSTAALGFVLYGGTAIALRLGHRASVDFDAPLDRDALFETLPFLRTARVLQEGATVRITARCWFDRVAWKHPRRRRREPCGPRENCCSKNRLGDWTHGGFRGIAGIFELAGKGDIFGIAAASLVAVVGFGLIKKARWGFILFFIGAGIAILVTLLVDLLAVRVLFSDSRNATDVIVQALTVTTVNVMWWVVPAVSYYRRRLNGFKKTVDRSL
jgi:hypothetical protein